MFRFTTRDLLWLTVVLTLALAWGIDHDRLTQRYRAFESVMRDHGLRTPDDVIWN